MRSHTLLIVAALVLGARAASIPAPAAPPALQQKLAEAVEQALQEAKPLDNVHSDQELIEQVNEIKEIDNSLRKVPHVVDAIPVKIVTEVVQPSVKNTADETKTALDDVEFDSEPEIKRVKVDLSNTGEPQRQEHDTQSPEQQSAEQETVANLKQTITDSQSVFNQGLQGVASGLQTWFTDNEQLASIQKSIQNLQVNFQTQLSKLNSTIQSYWKPEESAESTASSPTPAETASETSTDSKGILENVEKGLEVIENHFEYGVKSMVSGVQVLAAVKAENVSSSNNPLQGLSTYFETFQHNIVQGLNNLQATIQQYVTQNQQNISSSSTSTGPTTGIFQNIGQSFQNIVNLQNGQSTPAAGSVSDESAEGTTARPTIWQGIQSQIQNIWNRPSQSSTQNQQTQTNQNAAGNGPIAQVLQNNPLIQGVVNLIQGPTPPTVCVDCEESGSEGSNSVPAKPEEEKPQSDDQQKEKPATAPAPAPAPAIGPLAQIVQRNPIMQGLAGAVHKIQTSIVNPEKPREDGTKAGWSGGYGGHGHSPAQGNNNGDGVEGGKSEPLKEEAPVAAPEAPAAPADPPTLPEKKKECDKKKADLPVSDKTES